MKETNLSNRGVEFPNQDEQVRKKHEESCNKLHGGMGFGSQETSDKIRKSMMKNFGVDNISKSPLFYKYHRKRIFHDNIWFDSNWEILVYDFLKSAKIEFDYQPKMVLQYEYLGKVHYYHPDFTVNGKLYEVKGDNFFRINKETSREEMFCPYRYPDWTDEKYEWMCSLYEAKHQCMIANNVTIIRKKQLDNLSLVF